MAAHFMVLWMFWGQFWICNESFYKESSTIIFYESFFVNYGNQDLNAFWENSVNGWVKLWIKLNLNRIYFKNLIQTQKCFVQHQANNFQFSSVNLTHEK